MWHTDYFQTCRSRFLSCICPTCPTNCRIWPSNLEITATSCSTPCSCPPTSTEYIQSGCENRCWLKYCRMTCLLFAGAGGCCFCAVSTVWSRVSSHAQSEIGGIGFAFGFESNHSKLLVITTTYCFFTSVILLDFSESIFFNKLFF